MSNGFWTQRLSILATAFAVLLGQNQGWQDRVARTIAEYPTQGGKHGPQTQR